jgi:hypothetical protein
MNSQIFQRSTRSGIKRNKKSYNEHEDTVFNSENDMRIEKRVKDGMTQEEAQKNINGNDSDSSFSDKMDDMDDDELVNEEKDKNKK